MRKGTSPTLSINIAVGGPSGRTFGKTKQISVRIGSITSSFFLVAVTGKACLALCLAGVRVGRRAHSSFFSPTSTLPASYFSRNTRTLALHRPTHVSTRTHGSLQHHNHFKVRVETMGFIKRLLSMGSKKGKKSKREQLGGMPYEQTAHAATQGDLLDRKKEEEEQEAKASRLLRSSSAHFAVVSEVDYTSLPPIRAHNRLTFPLSFG